MCTSIFTQINYRDSYILLGQKYNNIQQNGMNIVHLSIICWFVAFICFHAADSFLPYLMVCCFLVLPQLVVSRETAKANKTWLIFNYWPHTREITHLVVSVCPSWFTGPTLCITTMVQHSLSVCAQHNAWKTTVSLYLTRDVSGQLSAASCLIFYSILFHVFTFDHIFSRLCQERCRSIPSVHVALHCFVFSELASVQPDVLPSGLAGHVCMNRYSMWRRICSQLSYTLHDHHPEKGIQHQDLEKWTKRLMNSFKWW